MRTLVGILIAPAAIWFAAVCARSAATRCVATRSVGLPAAIPAIPGAIDVGRRLWRGPAPSAATYRDLAEAGVGLVVDLRSEIDQAEVQALGDAADLEVLLLPTDNGRVPDPAHVDLLAEALEGRRDLAYIHCEAGEGRTGAIIGAYRVRLGDPVMGSIADALAVGSLTFAQLAFIATGGTKPAVCSGIDWTLDRPTERLFDLARRPTPDRQ